LNITHIQDKFWNGCHKHNSETPHYRYFTSMKHIVEHTRNILDSKTKLWEHYFPVIPLAMIINSMLKEKNCMILSTVVFVTPVQPSQTLLDAFMVNNTLPACSNQILSMKKKDDDLFHTPNPTKNCNKRWLHPLLSRYRHQVIKFRIHQFPTTAEGTNIQDDDYLIFTLHRT